MQQRDSRRLRGPNLLWEHPSAILDVDLAPGDDVQALVAEWKRQMGRMLPLLGWSGQGLASRAFERGAMLALAAPMDALLAATEVNEWAFAAAKRVLEGAEEPPLEAAATELKSKIESERNPKLPALRAAAIERGVPFFWDDQLVTLGMGRYARSYALAELPEQAAIDWTGLASIPTALVTGTNGKSTTVRLLGAIAEAAGKVAGLSSTDWVRIAGEQVDAGDYSGPVGARLVLRDPRVEIAILETARGGIMRRGLALEQVDVALVTNVAADHFGEFGNGDLAALCDTKFVVTRIARHVVLNADCEALHEPAKAVKAPITWFSRDERHPLVRLHVASGGSTCVAKDGAILLIHGGRAHAIERLERIPIALGGAARHNVENALSATAVAWHLGIAPEAIARGLRSFHSTPESNPGRMNEFELGGVRCMVDFAHNTHGFEALFDMAKALAPKRWLVLLGQAGDRDEASIREMTAATWAARPDRIVIKEMKKYLRGRSEGEVPAIIVDELKKRGAPDSVLVETPSEIEAVREALAWSRPGDLLLLLCHAERERALALLARMRESGWKPCEPVPQAASA